MPNPLIPEGVWEIAETAEMREVVGLYGKTFHFWQVDRGDKLPLGKPELMMSFTRDDQVSRKLSILIKHMQIYGIVPSRLHPSELIVACVNGRARYHGIKSRIETSGSESNRRRSGMRGMTPLLYRLIRMQIRIGIDAGCDMGCTMG